MAELHDRSLPAEGYKLTIRDDATELRFADPHGRGYGLQTFAQLQRGQTMLPDCVVEDHPDLASRGFMLDISRNRVPTRDTLARLVERLAICRFNQLQLYTEHTFAYRDHRAVWSDASPMTFDDMRWLDQTCTENRIELVANQNTFGHFERWLAHDAYRQRAECPDGFVLNDVRRPPTALAPSPENADFALDLVRELLESVTSIRVNIGCDEVMELGLGASAAATAAHGRSRVFVEHLLRLTNPLIADGYRVQFWADMLSKPGPNGPPEAARPLADAGAIAAVWCYDAPAAGGGFDASLGSFERFGFQLVAAAGTSGWNSFGGRHRNARANIRDAVQASITHGAEGVLITEWGDGGHMQPPFATMPAVAYAGATMWAHGANADMTDHDLASAVSTHLFHDRSGELALGMIELATVVDAIGVTQPNGSAHFRSWIDTTTIGDPAIARKVAAPDPGHLNEALAQVADASDRVARAKPNHVDGRQLTEETQLVADMTAHGIRRLGVDSGIRAETDLGAEFVDLQQRFRQNWLARSRPGGLEDTLALMREPE